MPSLPRTTTPEPEFQSPLEPRSAWLRYNQWMLRHAASGADLFRQSTAVHRLRYRPLISVVVPVFNTPPEMLRRMLACVTRQTYPNWQLCLVDDGSSEPWIARTLSRLAAADRRVRFLRRPTNGGISAATNDGLAMATGELVAFVDHDDEFDVRMLYTVVRQFNAHPETDAVHFDMDYLRPSGARERPYFAPGWSPELLLSAPYIVHVVTRRSCLLAVGDLRSECDGGQDYDFALRLAEVTDNIAHIPEVLYHWRIWPGSAALSSTAKPYAFSARKRAVTDALRRRGIAGQCVDGDWSGIHRVHFELIGNPLLSLILPLSDVSAPDGPAEPPIDHIAAQLQHLTQHTAYRRFEIVLVGPRRISTAVATQLQEHVDVMVRHVACDVTDLGLMVNLGAADAHGEHLVVLTSDVEPVNDEWLSSLLEYSQQNAIGAVGAQLYRTDGSVWHAGVIIPRGLPIGITQDILLNPGDFTEAINVTNLSAVSGACLMTRRCVFDEVGGFRPAHAVGFSDVDYCLRVRQRAHRIVCTPFARLRRTLPPRTMFPDNGASAFRQGWGKYTDPYHNPNLSPDGSFLPIAD